MLDWAVLLAFSLVDFLHEPPADHGSGEGVCIPSPQIISAHPRKGSHAAEMRAACGASYNAVLEIVKSDEARMGCFCCNSTKKRPSRGAQQTQTVPVADELTRDSCIFYLFSNIQVCMAKKRIRSVGLLGS